MDSGVLTWTVRAQIKLERTPLDHKKTGVVSFPKLRSRVRAPFHAPVIIELVSEHVLNGEAQLDSFVRMDGLLYHV